MLHGSLPGCPCSTAADADMQREAALFCCQPSPARCQRQCAEGARYRILPWTAAEFPRTVAPGKRHFRGPEGPRHAASPGEEGPVEDSRPGALILAPRPGTTRAWLERELSSRHWAGLPPLGGGTRAHPQSGRDALVLCFWCLLRRRGGNAREGRDEKRNCSGGLCEYELVFFIAGWLEGPLSMF